MSINIKSLPNDCVWFLFPLYNGCWKVHWNCLYIQHVQYSNTQGNSSNFHHWWIDIDSSREHCSHKLCYIIYVWIVTDHASYRNVNFMLVLKYSMLFIIKLLPHLIWLHGMTWVNVKKLSPEPLNGYDWSPKMLKPSRVIGHFERIWIGSHRQMAHPNFIQPFCPLYIIHVEGYSYAPLPKFLVFLELFDELFTSGFL